MKRFFRFAVCVLLCIALTAANLCFSTAAEKFFSEAETLLIKDYIEDDIDLGICKQRVHIVIQLGDVVVFLCIFRTFADQVADTDDLDVAEHVRDIFKIDTGNASDTDNTDLFHERFSFAFWTKRSFLFC